MFVAGFISIVVLHRPYTTLTTLRAMLLVVAVRPRGLLFRDILAARFRRWFISAALLRFVSDVPKILRLVRRNLITMYNCLLILGMYLRVSFIPGFDLNYLRRRHLLRLG